MLWVEFRRKRSLEARGVMILGSFFTENWTENCNHTAHAASQTATYQTE